MVNQAEMTQKRLNEAWPPNWVGWQEKPYTYGQWQLDEPWQRRVRSLRPDDLEVR